MLRLFKDTYFVFEDVCLQSVVGVTYGRTEKRWEEEKDAWKQIQNTLQAVKLLAISIGFLELSGKFEGHNTMTWSRAVHVLNKVKQHNFRSPDSTCHCFVLSASNSWISPTYGYYLSGLKQFWNLTAKN